MPQALGSFYLGIGCLLYSVIKESWSILHTRCCIMFGYHIGVNIVFGRKIRIAQSATQQHIQLHLGGKNEVDVR